MPTQNTDQFLQRFAAQVPDLRGKRICVGLSGGADSVVLLHVLAALRDTFGLADLSAVHVHHGLNAAADDWQRFCRDYAQRLGVGFSAARVQVDARKLGVEAAARTARYAVFAEQNADFVALAHHRDDQIETFFLAALRGGGLRALSAMPEQRALTEKTVLWRPLLAFSRAEIEQYAQDNALMFVHDDSNENPVFLRNWLRGRWLPDLAARLPHYTEHLHSSIALLQEERALLEEVTAQDWQAVRCAQGLHQARWQAFSPARQRQLLHTFGRTGCGRQNAANGVCRAAGPCCRTVFCLPCRRILRCLGRGRRSPCKAACTLPYNRPDWHGRAVRRRVQAAFVPRGAMTNCPPISATKTCSACCRKSACRRLCGRFGRWRATKTGGVLPWPTCAARPNWGRRV